MYTYAHTHIHTSYTHITVTLTSTHAWTDKKDNKHIVRRVGWSCWRMCVCVCVCVCVYEILFACVQFLLCFFLTRYSGVSAAPSIYTKHFLGALVSRELTTEQEVLNAVATVPSSQ